MVNNILTILMTIFNVVLIGMIIASFFHPSLVVYTFVLILCSYTFNEVLVERRLSKIEEILEKSKNNM